MPSGADQPLLEEPDAPEARWEEPNAPGARWEGPEIAQQAVAGPSSTVLSNSLAAPSPGPSVFGSGALPTRGRPGLYSTTSWDAVSGLGATKRTFRRSATELAGARNGGRALHTAFAGSGSTSLASPRLLDCDRSLLQRKLVCPPTTSRYLDTPWDDSGHGFERMATFREVLGDDLTPDLDAVGADTTCEVGPGASSATNLTQDSHAHRLKEVFSLSEATLDPRSAAASARWRAKHKFRAKHIAQLLFTLLCIAVAVCIYIRDSRHRHAWRNLNIPTATWFVVLASVFPTVRICGMCVDVLVRGVELAFHKVENIHYLLIGTSRGLRILTSVLVLLIVVNALLQHDEYRGKNGPMQTAAKASVCAVIFALVELLKTLGGRALSLRVHSKALFSKLRTTIEKEQMLHKLMSRMPAEASRSGSERYAAIGRVMRVPPWSVGLYLNKLRGYSLSMDSRHMSLTAQITRLIRQFEGMTEAQVDEHARRAAEFLWWTARQDVTALAMTRDDLATVLGNEADVDYLFRLFDVNGDQFVLIEEVQQRFTQMYRERRNLASTLLDTRAVMRTLELLVGGILHVAACFAYLAIFGVDVGHLVLSVSSVTLASAFVFGNSLRTIYESVVFLFLVHPYQVGDMIIYEGEKHTVQNFGLMSTQFFRRDGFKVWIPNQKLMGEAVLNVSQSRAYQDRVYFEVDARRVTAAMIDDLGDRVHALVRAVEHAVYFDQGFECFAYVHAVKDPLKYEIGVCYQLAFNTENYPNLCQARSRVLFVIGQWQVAHKMLHSQSVQPGFRMRTGDGGFAGDALFDSVPDFQDQPASSGLDASSPTSLRRRATKIAERARDAAIAELGMGTPPAGSGGSGDASGGRRPDDAVT